jgi:DNA-binding MarR family transcriptional regulator
MAEYPDPDQVAAALYLSVGLLRRRLRQQQAAGELPVPESAALARLERDGPTTAAALAKIERISPQSMGATLASLESRGLIRRRSDPADGRRVVLSLTDEGARVLRGRRDARAAQLASALAAGFTGPELRQLLVAAPLLERLAQSL